MAKRRANGEGTIFQRQDGRWCVAIYVPRPDGTRKRRFLYGKTHGEVAKKLTEIKRQIDQGIPIADDSWTVAAYLAYWLDHVVSKRRPKTAIGYEGVVRLHLVPGLGKKKLAKLTARDVRLFLANCTTKCICCDQKIDRQRDRPRCCAAGSYCERRLSVRMVQIVHAVLRNALQNAVREEILPRNVAKLVQVETPDYARGKGLPVDQTKNLLALVRRDRLYALYVLALTLGMRMGELLGLSWDAVDLDEGRLEIRQILQRVSGELRLGPPKTRHSRRVVPLPVSCVRALQEHHAHQAAERLQAGADWEDSGLVFTSLVGTPIDPRNLGRHWYRLRDRAGLGEYRFHDLRHTCVSLLLDLGVPPHVVREIVGHSDISVTMGIYAHASMEEKVKALRQLGEAFG